MENKTYICINSFVFVGTRTRQTFTKDKIYTQIRLDDDNDPVFIDDEGDEWAFHASSLTYYLNLIKFKYGK